MSSKPHPVKHTDKPSRNALKFGFFSVSEFSATFSIALPLAIGSIGERLIGITDSIMLGRIGPEALSASGLALSIYNLVMIGGFGMLFPMILLAAHARGSNRFQTIPLIVRQGLWICGILTVLGSAILWQVTPILILAGQDPGIARMAGDYMAFYLWTLFPVFSTFMFVLAFAAMGRARTAALIVWLEVALNAILDYGLVLGNLGLPALGMKGAGLASVIAYGTGHMVFFLLLAFHRFYRRAALFRHAWWPRWHVLKRFFHFGIPKSFEVSMRTGLYSSFSLLSGWIGTQALVIHTIVFETATVITYMSGSIANAGAARIGIAYAGKNHETIWHALGSMILILGMFLSLPALVFMIFPEWVAMLFLGFGSSQAKALTPLLAPVLVWAAFFLMAEGLRVVTVQALNGLSDMKAPALIGVFLYWAVIFPLGALLGFAAGFGVLGSVDI
ncbi:MAG: multidrug resistance protein, MATE family [Candidatus Kentron sp. G]|nr:MAG: multidrug resistance protein, MATE family [Candidatus Kentron sp. G]VFN03765.1 MAG: multidrug resistance protein, MATE family [Candidatus Kentron sp. G]VFN04791.1 MAG: multidrug resistance protein, MATE family [Candidatus Kentron sp. G]